MLAALTRLPRLACHPRLVVPDYRGPASKLETLLRLIDELREGSQRALAFRQLTSFLALVREALDATGIRYLMGAASALDARLLVREPGLALARRGQADADADQPDEPGKAPPRRARRRSAWRVSC